MTQTDAKPYSIVLLPGDGIGPEVVDATRQVLEEVGSRLDIKLSFASHLIGGHAVDEVNDALPKATYEACEAADALILGAVGGPKWDDPNLKVRPEQGLLGLRGGLQLYANLRPVKVHPALVDASPLKPERLAGVDMLVVRELTGGIYFGAPKFQEKTAKGLRAVDTMEYTEAEVTRIVRLAFRIAQTRKRFVTSVDKANVLKTSRMWRNIVDDLARDYPDVTVEHRLVDSAAMRLISEAASFDVIVTSNMFGDILTDEAAVLVGSLGLLPSASLGDDGPGLYEPIHGSAPDIAGKGIANPVGAILSGAMMLRHSLALPDAAEFLETAVAKALTEGARTRDIGGTLGTQAMTDKILGAL